MGTISAILYGIASIGEVMLIEMYLNDKFKNKRFIETLMKIGVLFLIPLFFGMII